MRTLKTLIDEAAAMCQGKAKLARRIGVTPQKVSAWCSGACPITPEQVAELCDVLELDGEEARRLAALAIAENPKNREKAGLLRRAFFVCWALGVAIAQHNDAHAVTIDPVNRNCTESTYALLARLFAAARALAMRARSTFEAPAAWGTRGACMIAALSLPLA